MNALVPWQPFLDLTEVMDRMMADSLPTSRGTTAVRAFPIDVFETIQTYRLEAALPGVKPANLAVTATDNTVTIRAVTLDEQEKDEGTYLRRERYRGEMQRIIALPAEIDPERVTSAYEHGILTIFAPKTEKARPKEVKVKVVTGK